MRDGGTRHVHLTSSPVDWYAARAAGIAAYVALTIVLSLGLALAGRARNDRWPTFAVEDVHRFGGLLVGWLVTLHVLTIAIDSYLPFSLAQLLVPFAARYRPLWTGLGIAAAELLLALALTNRYRKRLPHRIWRRAHYLNFAVWSAATLHGIGAGTDRSAPWLAALYACAVGVVTGLLVWRLRVAPLRSTGAGLAAAASFSLVLALVLGPFRHDPHPWNAASFTESLSGRILQSGVPTEAIVSMNGRGDGVQKLLVRADLLAGRVGLDATSLQLEYLPSGVVCRGQVTAVGSTSFAGLCRLPTGEARSIDASWQLLDDGTVSGTIRSAHA
jgi:sulfoxide reductase heme-binding subunit YedZ